jgi:hypothetical protein
MSSRHKRLHLDEVQAGMVLAEAVCDGHDGVLLPQATVLTGSLLSALRQRGIDIVCVIDDTVPEEVLKTERERVEKRLAQLFRKCEAQGACDILRQQVAEYRLNGAS